MKLLSFGEVLWDVYPDKACIGGAPLNFAAHAAIHGEDVAMLSAVGDDPLGKQTLDILTQRHIDTSFVRTVQDKPTGTCVVTLDDNAVPSYDLRDDVAWDAIDTDMVPADQFDVLYFGTLALRHKHNRDALCALISASSFAEIFADVNIRDPFYSDETILFALKSATILKISDEELPVVLKAVGVCASDDHLCVCRAIAEKFSNIRLIILTKGGDGADAYTVADDTFVSVPVVPAKVLSTVGAGDSFSAAFLHCHQRGDATEDCLRYASKIAALVVSHYDAVPDYKPL